MTEDKSLIEQAKEALLQTIANGSAHNGVDGYAAAYKMLVEAEYASYVAAREKKVDDEFDGNMEAPASADEAFMRFMDANLWKYNEMCNKRGTTMGHFEPQSVALPDLP